MNNFGKFGAFAVLIFIFGGLFELSILLRGENLPTVRFCCTQNDLCDAFGENPEILASNININLDHNTRFEVVKGMPFCEYPNELQEYYINKV